MRGHLAPVVGAGLLVTIAAAVSLVAPRVAGLAVDTVLAIEELTESRERLKWIAIGLVLLFAVRALTTWAQVFLVGKAGARMLRDLRDRVYAQLVLLTSDFYESRRLGELLSRMSSDLERVQTTITRALPDGIYAAITLVGILVVLLTINARLTLVIGLVVPPIVIIATVFGKFLQRSSREVQDAKADATAAAEQALSGIQTVQAFGAEQRERERHRTQLDAIVARTLRFVHQRAAFLSSLQFVGFSAFALVLWFGGVEILEGRLTAGELTAFLLYSMTVAGSVGSLGSLYVGLRELRGASQRVLELLEAKPSITESATAKPPRSEGPAAISLEDVSFQYPTRPGEWALENLSLEIAPGETVALVGPSGAGKSTLFGLLLRFRDASSGTVRFCGDDVRDLELEPLRRAIALVPQDVFIFHGSVADNILYSRPDADDDAVREAARDAGAAEFIEALPDGFETQVGERGVKLSAGQRQRIAIARAFLRRPRLLLLDEATASLDPDSEALIQQSLERLTEGRTTLVIAHRLATARRADRIAVLERGALRDIGRHGELFRESELYRRYWQLQSLTDQERAQTD